MADGIPAALDQQHISAVHLLAFQVIEDVFAFTPNAEDVDVVFVSEPRFPYGTVDQAQSRHQDDLCDTDVVKVQ